MGNEHGKMEGDTFVPYEGNLGPRTTSDPAKRHHKHKLGRAPSVKSKHHKKKRTASSSDVLDPDRVSTGSSSRSSSKVNGSYDSGLSEHDSADLNSLDYEHQKRYGAAESPVDITKQPSAKQMSLSQFVDYLDNRKPESSKKITGLTNAAFFDADDATPDFFSEEAEAEIDALEEENEFADSFSEDSNAGSEFSLNDIPSEDESMANDTLKCSEHTDTNFNMVCSQETGKNENNGEIVSDAYITVTDKRDAGTKNIILQSATEQNTEETNSTTNYISPSAVMGNEESMSKEQSGDAENSNLTVKGQSKNSITNDGKSISPEGEENSHIENKTQPIAPVDNNCYNADKNTNAVTNEPGKINTSNLDSTDTSIHNTEENKENITMSIEQSELDIRTTDGGLNGTCKINESDALNNSIEGIKTNCESKHCINTVEENTVDINQQEVSGSNASACTKITKQEIVFNTELGVQESGIIKEHSTKQIQSAEVNGKATCDDLISSGKNMDDSIVNNIVASLLNSICDSVVTIITQKEYGKHNGLDYKMTCYEFIRSEVNTQKSEIPLSSDVERDREGLSIINPDTGTDTEQVSNNIDILTTSNMGNEQGKPGHSKQKKSKKNKGSVSFQNDDSPQEKNSEPSSSQTSEIDNAGDDSGLDNTPVIGEEKQIVQNVPIVEDVPIESVTMLTRAENVNEEEVLIEELNDISSKTDPASEKIISENDITNNMDNQTVSTEFPNNNELPVDNSTDEQTDKITNTIDQNDVIMTTDNELDTSEANDNLNTELNDNENQFKVEVNGDKNSTEYENVKTTEETIFQENNINYSDFDNKSISDENSETGKDRKEIDVEYNNENTENVQVNDEVMLTFVKSFIEDVVQNATDQLEHEIMTCTVKNVVDDLINASLNVTDDKVGDKQVTFNTHLTEPTTAAGNNTTDKTTYNNVVGKQDLIQTVNTEECTDNINTDTAVSDKAMGNTVSDTEYEHTNADIISNNIGSGVDKELSESSSDGDTSSTTSGDLSVNTSDAESHEDKFEDCADVLHPGDVNEADSTDVVENIAAVDQTISDDKDKIQQTSDISEAVEFILDSAEKIVANKQVEEDVVASNEEYFPSQNQEELLDKSKPSVEVVTSETANDDEQPEVSSVEGRSEGSKVESQSENSTGDNNEECIKCALETTTINRKDTAQWSVVPQIDENESFNIDDDSESVNDGISININKPDDDQISDDKSESASEESSKNTLASIKRHDTAQWSTIPEIDDSESYNIDEIDDIAAKEGSVHGGSESFYSDREDYESCDEDNVDGKTNERVNVTMDKKDVLEDNSEVKMLNLQPTLTDCLNHKRFLATPTESAASEWSTKVEVDDMDNYSIDESNLTIDTNDDDLSDDSMDKGPDEKQLPSRESTKPIVSETKDIISKTIEKEGNNTPGNQAGPENQIIDSVDDNLLSASERNLDDNEKYIKTREEKMVTKGEKLFLKRQKDEKEALKWGKGVKQHEKSNYGSMTSLTLLSRRSSNDSTASEPSLRELKEHLAEVEEKYKQAMVQNAQLDNERSTLHYRVETMKDLLEEQEEELYRLKSTHKTTCQALAKEKRLHDALQMKMVDLQEALRQRDELIQNIQSDDKKCEKLTQEIFGYKETVIWKDKKIEALMRQLNHYKEIEAERKKEKEQGLVMVGGNGMNESSDDEADGPHYALVTQEAAQVLETAGDGPLNTKLKHLADERNDLLDEVRRLRTELEEERNNNLNNGNNVYAENGVGDMQLLEIQRDASRQISEYKFKLQKSEQDTAAYQANISRLENQLQRIKATSEALERSEDEMRADKRKLQRDLRATLDKMEELEMTNSHLEKRLERLRAQRSTS